MFDQKEENENNGTIHILNILKIYSDIDNVHTSYAYIICIHIPNERGRRVGWLIGLLASLVSPRLGIVGGVPVDVGCSVE